MAWLKFLQFDPMAGSHTWELSKDRSKWLDLAKKAAAGADHEPGIPLIEGSDYTVEYDNEL